MKKLMFLVAASLFVFAACSSEDDSSPEVILKMLQLHLSCLRLMV